MPRDGAWVGEPSPACVVPLPSDSTSPRTAMLSVLPFLLGFELFRRPSSLGIRESLRCPR